MKLIKKYKVGIVGENPSYSNSSSLMFDPGSNGCPTATIFN